jgi:hypothetical protein
MQIFSEIQKSNDKFQISRRGDHVALHGHVAILPPYLRLKVKTG